ncbi:peroxiredoxin-like family protein [Mycolicibacterium moriokaense]|uniref:thioredoxin-dependent peroxiredoxin n=1 Tax=Mycolicibacterium moriokaense TaxID=39691 RepID=A0A318HA35_9MYCO|nr:peroxiredoxin-like family protein [Mycolicibacterium moriokaense]PXX00316.1 peroxiredoxin [Mycolicibacterium moriokaense]
MLETALAAQRLYAYTNRSAKERAVRANAVDVVGRDRLAENAIAVGDQAPMFVLQDGIGAEVDVQVLLKTGPVVLCFYRGGWCPYCNLELRAYQQQLGRITTLGATLVAISPELPDRTLTTAEVNQLGYPVLSDVDNVVARQYRLTHTIDPPVVRYQLGNGNGVAAFNGSACAEVPLPATYIIGTDGAVQFAFVRADYTRRAEPENVLAVLRDLTAAAHPAPAGARL